MLFSLKRWNFFFLVFFLIPLSLLRLDFPISLKFNWVVGLVGKEFSSYGETRKLVQFIGGLCWGDKVGILAN